MTFKKENYIETCKAPRFFSLLFGPLYFIFKGSVRHAVISFILAALTGGVSHFIYPLFTKSALRGHYGRKGFEEVTE